MAEASVKTFKREYVYINNLPNAKTVMGCLNDWFNDYNEKLSHKGLKQKSLREFIREVAAVV